MSEPVAMLLDCDPGHDDAMAIMAAARHAELVAITTVAGNAPLTSTTYNACVLRDLIAVGGGPEIPVHAGAARPLVSAPAHGAFVHGESGLDGAELPEPSRGADSGDAVTYIIETCRQREGLWLVATGPLTNVALALRADPGLIGRIAGISLMGGGTFGNRTPAAEFNIWADPEAAAVVFDAPVPLLMAGLDVTYQFQATAERIAAIRAVPGQLAEALAELLTFFSGNYISRHEDIAGAAVHDPLAVLALTHPDVFGRERRHVAVETSGSLTRGMTVIDRRTLLDRPSANADVLTTVDADAAWDVIVDAVRAFSS